MWLSVHATLWMGVAGAADDPAPDANAMMAKADVGRSDRVATSELPNSEAADPARGTRDAKLLGVGNCSWTTSLLARRALNDGVPHTYVGHLEPSDNQLSSRVAAPFTVGPAGALHVVANEVLGLMHRSDLLTSRVELRGRVLEVDTVRYLVITEFARVGG